MTDFTLISVSQDDISDNSWLVGWFAGWMAESLPSTQPTICPTGKIYLEIVPGSKKSPQIWGLKSVILKGLPSPSSLAIAFAH
ncbi:MAG: hypothetical protein Kow0031_00020 [Anaerolineae bacterium]